jgi:hypothetical protein
MTVGADHLAVADLAAGMAEDNLENNNSATTQSFAIFVTIKRFAK